MVASMAFPGIYEPVRIGRHLLVDGGVLNPVPVSSCVALGADLVVSSNLSSRSREARPGGDAEGTKRRRFLVENIARTLEIMQSKIVEQSCNRADVAIEPRFDPAPGLLDFKRGRRLERVGEEAVERALPRLREVLPWLA
jgi:NTE family protein